MNEVAGVAVSAKTIERVVHDVGRELAERRDADPRSDRAMAQTPQSPPQLAVVECDKARAPSLAGTGSQSPPQLAVVECDGGRIRTREPGHGPGVHLAGEGWREDKNACLIRALRTTAADDPQPEPPECFRDPKHAAKIAETEALSLAAPTPKLLTATSDDVVPIATRDATAWRPKRLVRTVLSSVAEAKVFGGQMAREAKRRRFFDAEAKAFLGDGLGWNWSIWKKHFADFTPILDFIHVLSYLFVTAKAVHTVAGDAWDQYLAWMRGCWRGDVAQVLEELRHRQTALGPPPAGAPDADPRKVVAKTITSLENNQARMNYPEYRRQGLPVTTAWMESLVKEINYRAKGTEMFWNDPRRRRSDPPGPCRRAQRRRPPDAPPPNPPRLPLYSAPPIPQLITSGNQKLTCTRPTRSRRRINGHRSCSTGTGRGLETKMGNIGDEERG
jgi:hypothetical protein